MDPVIVLTKFEVRSFIPIPKIIAINVLGGGCESQSWERGGGIAGTVYVVGNGTVGWKERW